MEALGEAQETADFFTLYSAGLRAATHAFDHALPDDPLTSYASHNRSVLKPYGRVGGDRARSTSRSRSPAGPPPPRSSPATRSSPRARAPPPGPIGCSPTASAMRACRPGVFNYLSGPRRGHRRGADRAPADARASRSPVPTRWAWGSCGRCRRRPSRVRASPRWAARMPASSPRRRISSVPRSASCAPPTAWAARSARRSRASTCDEAVADELIERAARADRRDPHRRPDAARALAGTGHHRARPTSSYARYMRNCCAPAAPASSPAASSCAEGPWRADSSCARRSPRRRTITRCGSRRCSCRS